MKLKISISDIEEARRRIADVVLRTRFEESLTASQLVGTKVFFKFENEQRTGSFKIRGALNKLRSLSLDEKKRGVVASSAGNHAQGVALASAEAGVSAKIIMPETSPLIKQVATKAYGAEVVLHGQIYDDAFEFAQKVAAQENRVFIHPFQDEKVIAGQGTLGLEIYEQAKDLDSIIVPIGGGGLISGVATVLKHFNPRIKIYGAVAENAPGVEALFHGKKIPTDLSFRSIADGISVKSPSPVMFESFLKDLVDDVIRVSEDDIAEAILFLLERSKSVVEGSAAISLAAARLGQLKLGSRTCCLLCGGNIDMNLVSQILDRGLMRSGRVGRVSVLVDDRPGTLQALTQIIALNKGNVMDVHHDRTSGGLHIREAVITFMLESRDHGHLDVIRQALRNSGIALRVIE